MKKLISVTLNLVFVSMLFGIKGGILLKETYLLEKSCTIQPIDHIFFARAHCRDTMIGEGFEDYFPPHGWDTLSTPGGTQGGEYPIPWNQYGNPYNHFGSYGAVYGWGYNLDGWLRILNLNFSQALFVELSFWWMSNFEWSVYPYDNADLFVEVSTDAGTSWDTIWTFGDSADVVNSQVPWPWGMWVWYQSFINLDDYAGLSGVYIGFHVVADDNADIAIDDVVIDTSTTAIGEEILGTPDEVLLLSAPTIIRSGETHIEFTLPEKTRVNLSVYDVMGRLAKTLVSQRLSAGTHWLAVQFNLPTGVYFYNLKTDLGKDITKKFSVID